MNDICDVPVCWNEVQTLRAMIFSSGESSVTKRISLPSAFRRTIPSTTGDLIDYCKKEQSICTNMKSDLFQDNKIAVFIGHRRKSAIVFIQELTF
jgi:hypothetical protein